MNATATQELTLPKPDNFGNYWLAEKRGAPAILRSKKRAWNETENRYDVIFNGVYFATTADGPILNGAELRMFKTPASALAAIKGLI
jgi:hypothetical protein